DYKIDKPQAEREQKFCSEAALNMINISDKEKLTDLDICGSNLKYYDENFSEIQNPGSTDLVDGETYYITTSENGCESEPLEIEAVEEDCGCLADEINFFDLNYGRNYDECNMGGINGTSIAAGGLNSVADQAVMVTPGKDPWLASINEDLDRTSTIGDGCSSSGEAFRIGTPANRAHSISAEKEF